MRTLRVGPAQRHEPLQGVPYSAADLTESFGSTSRSKGAVSIESMSIVSIRFTDVPYDGECVCLSFRNRLLCECHLIFPHRRHWRVKRQGCDLRGDSRESGYPVTGKDVDGIFAGLSSVLRSKAEAGRSIPSKVDCQPTSRNLSS